MAAWKYIKGSEKDFEGAPEWCMWVEETYDGELFFIEGRRCGDRYQNKETGNTLLTGEEAIPGTIIAQRIPVTSINDDRLARDMGLNPKYNRPCKGVTIDVYDVLQAFNVTNPALQHLVKKALAVGQRGHKDKLEDLRDILASAQRAIELEESGK